MRWNEQGLVPTEPRFDVHSAIPLMPKEEDADTFLTLLRSLGNVTGLKPSGLRG